MNAKRKLRQGQAPVKPNTSSDPGRLGPLDERVLEQVCIEFGDDDGTLALELVSAFSETADIFELSTALPDIIEQSTIAHRAQQLRGAAVMVGAQQVARLCQQIEAASLAADSEATDALTLEMTEAIARANAALARAVIHAQTRMSSRQGK